MSEIRVAMAAGLVSLLLVAGALAFQYLGSLPPCEMCHWQRWPHVAAAIIGLGLGGVIARTHQARTRSTPLALTTLLLVGISGGIGAYQAGVEWGILPGPAACTGGPVFLTGSLDLNHPVVRCDVAAWRLFGISLAGFNALISFCVVFFGLSALFMIRKRSLN
ncbi:MAG: disulfide bond formation protein B [Alphaproteobacteria bacterium]|nr:disulfide bond formation protein B [Alphaproteobacteria bacterium]